MNKIKAISLLLSHGIVGVIGFVAGIYVLPILIAPPAPSSTEVMTAAEAAHFSGEFRRDLAGSDALHWGEGRVFVGGDRISFSGKLAPGPDYKLYLSPEFVESEVEFLEVKARMVRVGDVKTFENFLVPLPATVDPSQYTTAVVWCETFGEFITAAEYR